MSSIKKKIVKNEKAWDNLPDTDLLPTYFNRKDIAELSLVNKNYRHQLRRQVFDSVFIPVPKKFTKYRNNFSQTLSGYVLENLTADLAGRFNLVNKLILRTNMSNVVLDQFSKIFPNLTHIKIVSFKDFYYGNFIKYFSRFDYLEYVSIECSTPIFKNLHYRRNYEFLYKLKTIRLKFPISPNLSYPTDVIDSSFNNLKHLTFVNNNMLNKLSGGLPSLTFVEFLRDSNFEKNTLCLFFRNNPQLRKLSISPNHLDEEVVESIMELNKLDQFIINDDFNFLILS